MLLPISRVICCSLAIVASPLLIAIGSNLAQEATAIPVPDPAVADAQKVDGQNVDGQNSDASTLVPQPTDKPPVQIQFPSAVQPNPTPTNLLPDEPHVGLPPDHPLVHHENSEVGGIEVQLHYANFGRQSSPSQVCFDSDNKLVDNRIDAHRKSMAGADHYGQFLAPEVTVRFGSGCTHAEYTHWKLSSLDKPCAEAAIPHGPLVVEIKVDQPVDFVELLFDGKPLKPTAYTNHAPLSYSIPCPAPGQHWLQARYLSDNVWSHYSKPIRFEVRVPPQPRIIAASDFDRDPTPLARHTTTSITTHSIKVHLADVNHGDHIVAYIDGKPLPCSSCSHVDHIDDHLVPVEGEGHLCCRVFRVEGAATPGVHKLTVRVVGCGGACSITSQPSNPIAFHYYNEDAYLLRPGIGCVTCNPTDALAIATPVSTSAPMLDHRVAQSNVLPKNKLIAIVAAPTNPAAEAARLVELGQRFLDLGAADSTSLKIDSDLTNEHAIACAELAERFPEIRKSAFEDLSQFGEQVNEATRLVSGVATLDDAEPNALLQEAKTANASAEAAVNRVREAYTEIEHSTEAAYSNVESCQALADATAKAHSSAVEFLRQATEAFSKMQAYATEARRAQDVNNLAVAEQARLKATAEFGKLQTAQQGISELVATIREQKQASAKLRGRVTVHLADAELQVSQIQAEKKKVADMLTKSKDSIAAAKLLEGRLQNPDLQAVRSFAESAQNAHVEAVVAAKRAEDLASEAKAASTEAQAVAESVQTAAENWTTTLADVAASRHDILNAQNRAEMATQRAYAETAKYSATSTQAKVAKRIAASAEADRESVRKLADEANNSYSAVTRNKQAIAAYANDAATQALQARNNAFEAKRNAQAAVEAENAALRAALAVEKKSKEVEEALANKKDSLPTWREVASQEMSSAEQAARDAEVHRANAMMSANLAKKFLNSAKLAEDNALESTRVYERLEELRQTALSHANTAETKANQAGLSRSLQQQLTSVIEDAELAATQDQLRSQIDNLSNASSSAERDRAELATAHAEQAEARSDARVQQHKANLRIESANRVMSPQSPFYFASAAHFPLREFGLRGEPLDRDGIIIYEDMAFHFDREGNYEVHFRASAPKMPATIRLQFQIQPHRNSPWYTVTLAPIEFPYPVSKDDKSQSSCGTCEADCKHDSKNCCGKARECVCKGHSEILRRCYGEMSEDAKIRRTGSARIGFGISFP
jgi:hypothetical protein